MKKLLTTITLLCFSVAANAVIYYEESSIKFGLNLRYDQMKESINEYTNNPSRN
jgi:uncharacterized protein YxeA